MDGDDLIYAFKRDIRKPANKICAECLSSEVEYASLIQGVYICADCSDLHIKLNQPASNTSGDTVVSISTHNWSPNEMQFMLNNGNATVNSIYEKALPLYYHRPQKDDPQVLKDQWMEAKYTRQEFTDQSQLGSYTETTKTGSLYKRLKDGDKFQRRKFVLNSTAGTLQYFIKFKDTVPKDTISIEHVVNIYMTPLKVDNPFGMQLTYKQKDDHIRNLYLHADDGKTASDWYHAIRSALLTHKYPGLPAEVAIRNINNSLIIKEGWMTKTGPKKLEKFRRRWFSLTGNSIWYYENQLNAFPLGIIDLGSVANGYSVKKGLPQGVTNEEGYSFTVHTPRRIYVLGCTDLESRDDWVEHVDKIITNFASSQKVVIKIKSHDGGRNNGDPPSPAHLRKRREFSSMDNIDSDASTDTMGSGGYSSITKRSSSIFQKFQASVRGKTSMRKQPPSLNEDVYAVVNKRKDLSKQNSVPLSRRSTDDSLFGYGVPHRMRMSSSEATSDSDGDYVYIIEGTDKVANSPLPNSPLTTSAGSQSGKAITDHSPLKFSYEMDVGGQATGQPFAGGGNSIYENVQSPLKSNTPQASPRTKPAEPSPAKSIDSDDVSKRHKQPMKPPRKKSSLTPSAVEEFRSKEENTSLTTTSSITGSLESLLQLESARSKEIAEKQDIVEDSLRAPIPSPRHKLSKRSESQPVLVASPTRLFPLSGERDSSARRYSSHSMDSMDKNTAIIEEFVRDQETGTSSVPNNGDSSADIGSGSLEENKKVDDVKKEQEPKQDADVMMLSGLKQTRSIRSNQYVNIIPGTPTQHENEQISSFSRFETSSNTSQDPMDINRPPSVDRSSLLSTTENEELMPYRTRVARSQISTSIQSRGSTGSQLSIDYPGFSVDQQEDWKQQIQNTTSQRIPGHKRVRNAPTRRSSSRRGYSPGTTRRTSSTMSTTETPCDIEVTLFNHSNERVWFLAFQCEVEYKLQNSYLTPWVGAAVAGRPASIGPFKIPSNFEIAVIDTTQGGFELQRTTGPFDADVGEVWTVELAEDDDGFDAPEMFYYEDLKTNDNSVLVYASEKNTRKVEIAVFKAGRKLFSRKGIRPGEMIKITLKPSIYFLAVDQDTYYDMEGEDISAVEITSKASRVDLNYRLTKTKVYAKKRGEGVYFSSERSRPGYWQQSETPHGSAAT